MMSHWTILMNIINTHDVTSWWFAAVVVYMYRIYPNRGRVWIEARSRLEARVCRVEQLIEAWYQIVAGSSPPHILTQPTEQKNPRGTHTMSRRCSYDVAFKLNAVECARKKSKEAAAREFGVATRSIRLWCSQKEELFALKKTRKCQTRLSFR